jgi:MFS family permease
LAEAIETVPALQVDAKPLGGAARAQLLLSAGFILLLLQFAGPHEGLIGLPVNFFLKNKLHMPAQAVAAFNLAASIPLYLSFVFGLIRDRWSPFGAGDRGHLVTFGLITAALYAILAFLPPSYPVLLVGVLVVLLGFQMVSSAGRGLTSAIGNRHAVTGQASSVINMAALLPGLFAFLMGGYLSQALEGREAVMAARILFLVGGTLMLVLALIGGFGPRRLFAESAQERGASTFLGDVKRLARHWPIYPALAIYALWQFGPAGGAALQFHLANNLHATDAQVGIWYALFSGGFLPGIAAYAFLCQKLKLSTLLWIGTAFAVPQFAPFLFLHDLNGAFVAAVIMGLVGAIGQAAYTDLAIRSCPPGLQGTMMMFLITMYWVPYRFGDLWGSYLYDKAGGFQTAVLATIGVYALIIPILFLVPKRLIATVDGQTIERT